MTVATPKSVIDDYPAAATRSAAGSGRIQPMSYCDRSLAEADLAILDIAVAITSLACMAFSVLWMPGLG